MYRLEQSFRWRTYVEKRQDIADKLFQVTFNSLHEAVRTYPATTGDRLPDLDASVNETFLFHGARMPSAFCVGCLDVRGMSGGRRHFTLHFLRPCAQARNRKTSATSSAVAWMSTIRLMPACSVAAFTWLTQLAKATNTQPPCGRATTTPRISARRAALTHAPPSAPLPTIVCMLAGLYPMFVVRACLGASVGDVACPVVPTVGRSATHACHTYSAPYLPLNLPLSASDTHSTKDQRGRLDRVAPGHSCASNFIALPIRIMYLCFGLFAADMRRLLAEALLYH